MLYHLLEAVLFPLGASLIIYVLEGFNSSIMYNMMFLDRRWFCSKRFWALFINKSTNWLGYYYMYLWYSDPKENASLNIWNFVHFILFDIARIILMSLKYGIYSPAFYNLLRTIKLPDDFTNGQLLATKFLKRNEKTNEKVLK